ncbi:Gfo/Idh/MocA family oxidoreductase [Paratissierella segnis]|jgi:myo-inositol 2-dehydrogenase/D-chiro-inositol 1-dehydrogenase|uniref:Gfo/Idh/MocA family oxidoreductase n=1 Tax=Paratissierella segnis TaxID=2763679 RepID=A0A926IJA4_9FIRM|nr:Gfo/Idh/MocA family oxidoreductase [Paratissierella segnis]MBC8587221.1 Gfo/Idh/MocA family oxidoreductase [Paratissierella segnis]
MRKLKMGIVGLGRLGKKHAENIAFRVPNAELLAVCSIKEDEVEEAQKNWGIPFGYTNFKEMLNNKELEAAFIASSSTEHSKQIELALNAGLHVFSEKPLGITREEVIYIADIINKHKDKKFMLGFMRRFDPSYVYAKKKLDNGEIGKPIYIRCYSIDPISAIDGAIAFSEKSGGLFLDMMIHDLDLSRWFSNSEAKTVFAVGDNYIYPEFEKYDDIDNGAAMIQFNNGTIASFFAGRTSIHGYHIETEIIGTKGTLRIGTIPEKNLVTIFNENGAVRECHEGFLERFEDAYLNELQEFVDCVLEDRKTPVGAFDGLKATEIGYACRKSFATKQIVML